MYKRWQSVLIEAQGIIMSENNYNYADYESRVVLNYAVGFMKQEIKKEEIECLKRQRVKSR